MTTSTSQVETSFAKLSRLRDSVLKTADYLASTRELHLTFHHWEMATLNVHLRGILHMSISATDERETEPVVLSANAEVIKDGGKQALETMGYLWRDSKGTVRHYPGVSLIYFAIEGDTCIRVVCQELKVIP